MLAASYNVQSLVRRAFGQVPGGMFGADENARIGFFDPRQGTETCGFVEQMASDEIMLLISGDPYWADHLEDVAFNSYPASLMPDYRALRYLTCPNMAISDSRNHHPGLDNSGPFLAMNRSAVVAVSTIMVSVGLIMSNIWCWQRRITG